MELYVKYNIINIYYNYLFMLNNISDIYYIII